MPEYAEVLQRLKEGQLLLDMACCFCQEIRSLRADGAPSEYIYGCDLHQEYIDLGYRFFLDEGNLKSTFLTANIFDAPSALTKYHGSFDLIYTGSFFHPWDYEGQLKASKAVASLLRLQNDSMILGRQVGAVTAGEEVHDANTARRMYRHNAKSFQDVWKTIEDDMGVTFTVEFILKPLEQDHFRFHTDDTRRIWFVIPRK